MSVVSSRSKPLKSTRFVRRLTVSKSYEGGLQGKSVPMLRLRGEWLRRLGFRSGNQVVLTLSAKKVVITVVEKGR